MYDDYRVTSELYRLMPPRKRTRSGDLGDALEAARVTGPDLHEALDEANGTAPADTDSGGAPSRPDIGAPGYRRWARHLGRALGRVDVWILIATIAGVVIAYLTLVKR
jgi:hypothetical protein